MLSEGRTLDHQDLEPSFDQRTTTEPRTVDVATWVARGIVVATLGLMILVLGLIAGLVVADPGPTAASGPAAAGGVATTSTGGPVAEPETPGTHAPPVRVSPASTVQRAAPVATARSVADATTRSTPTSALTSPASTPSPLTHGRSGNTVKPKPTKP